MTIDGTHVETSYGHLVRVYESSASIGPHCWLGILDGPRNISAHLNLAQAVEIRDRLNAFIESATPKADS